VIGLNPAALWLWMGVVYHLSYFRAIECLTARFPGRRRAAVRTGDFPMRTRCFAECPTPALGVWSLVGRHGKARRAPPPTPVMREGR
jgi:hypothetical protein